MASSKFQYGDKLELYYFWSSKDPGFIVNILKILLLYLKNISYNLKLGTWY